MGIFSAIKSLGSGTASAGKLAGRHSGLTASIAAGGVYGAMSDDTSVLGGMAMGAGLYGAALAGKAGSLRYNKLLGRGMSRGQAAAGAARMMGRNAKRFIGSSMAKSKSYISTPLNKGSSAVAHETAAVMVPAAATSRSSMYSGSRPFRGGGTNDMFDQAVSRARSTSPIAWGSGNRPSRNSPVGRGRGTRGAGFPSVLNRWANRR